MFRHLAAVASALVLLSGCVASDPSGRQTFVTRESAVVLYTSVNDPFEVRFKAGLGAPDYWCAAGRFADQQRLSGSTRIYRLTPNPRPQGSGMIFTFVPPAPGEAQPTGLMRISSNNDSLSAFQARDQCNVVRLRTQPF
jgi:hypothetical protein